VAVLAAARRTSVPPQTPVASWKGAPTDRASKVESDIASTGRPWATIAALVFLTVVAALLRLPFLDHQSLWWDETFTRGIVRQSGLGDVWRQIQATESTPPLYYVLVWLTGGRSAAAMRLIPALALILAVPASYKMARQCAGRNVALATAAVVATSPELVSYSTDARSYGLFVLTAILSVWAFLRLLRDPGHLRGAAWVLASAACVWTHYFGIFVVGAEALALLAMNAPARRVIVGWTGVLVVTLAPLVPLVSRQSGDERAQFIAGISLPSRLSATVRQFAMGPNVPRTWLEAAGLLTFGAAVVVGTVVVLRRSSRMPLALLAVAAIGFLAPLGLALVGIEDRFYARNLVALLPLIAFLAAPALLRARGIPLAAYCLLATVTSVWVATNWRYEQVDWRTAVARMRAVDPSAVVVASSPVSAPVVQIYLHRRPVTNLSHPVSRAWIAVEPTRVSGERALSPGPSLTLPGFSTVQTFQVHAFRLTLVSAKRPTRPSLPASFYGAVFPGGT
jgi:4-amino-4-deoxy-L-arabinose transferase-like glycosyltransferase